MAQSTLQRLGAILVYGIVAFARQGIAGQDAVPTALKPEPTKTVSAAVSVSSNIKIDSLSDGNHYLRRGEFDEAINAYNLVLQQHPTSPDAYAGLVHVRLKQKRVDDAFAIAKQGLAVTDSATVHTALGEVLFRQGKITEAEREWARVINRGFPIARAYWGLARVRWAVSLDAQAQKMIDKAHESDPYDPDIQIDWIDSQSHADQIKFWEEYLASPTSDDAETRADYQRHLEYLRTTLNQPPRACRLKGNFTSLETNLLGLYLDPTQMRGYGLAVSVNSAKAKLELDTGASGLTLDQGVAKKAGIVKISDTSPGGIGNQKRPNGYLGYANSVKIGNLEFQDCLVEVVEKRSVVDEDGLIGSDFFSEYLVDIDFRREKFLLSPLPPRPGEPSTERSAQSPATVRIPHDRYIAPEMQSYTPVYEIGQKLLIPTTMSDQSIRLFAIDTGASSSLLSLRAAREFAKVYSTPQIDVRGINGRVEKVYTANDALLQFANLRQEHQRLVTFDLSSLSDDVGTEVSGLLGMSTLFLLDMRIDYRDGIIDFKYNSKP